MDFSDLTFDYYQSQDDYYQEEESSFFNTPLHFTLPEELKNLLLLQDKAHFDLTDEFNCNLSFY